MEKLNFVYITTNLLNGKQYVGDHSTYNQDDGYLGSGRPYFSNAIKVYGKENFKREILEFFSTKKTKKGSIGYWKGKHTWNYMLTKLTDDRVKSQNHSHICSEETKAKISHARMGQSLSLEHIEKIRQSAIGHKRQTGEKNSQLGRKWMNNPITLENKPIKQEEIQKYLDLNWVFGKTKKINVVTYCDTSPAERQQPIRKNLT